MKNMATCPALLNFCKSWNLSQRYFLEQSSGCYTSLWDSLFRPLNIYYNVPIKQLFHAKYEVCFPLDTKWLSELRPIKIFVLAFLEGLMQRINYDMSPKIRILFHFL